MLTAFHDAIPEAVAGPGLPAPAARCAAPGAESARTGEPEPAHPGSGWCSRLDVEFRRLHGRSVVRSRHDGALRCLSALHPEGDAVCHQVLVHPPGGLVGGDGLHVQLQVRPGAHGLLTTPGASRFYRSLGAPAVQSLDATLHAGSRLEWLPLENIAFDACIGENRARFHLAPGAELIAWDMLALGLPAAARPFASGSFLQHMELPGLWLERGRIDAADTTLLQGPGGLAGNSAIGTLVFASASPIAAPRRELLLHGARQALQGVGGVVAGATCAHPQVVVLRAIGQRIEPIATLFRAVWAGWRVAAWDLPACAPRVWST